MPHISRAQKLARKAIKIRDSKAPAKAKAKQRDALKKKATFTKKRQVRTSRVKREDKLTTLGPESLKRRGSRLPKPTERARKGRRIRGATARSRRRTVVTSGRTKPSTPRRLRKSFSRTIRSRRR